MKNRLLLTFFLLFLFFILIFPSIIISAEDPSDTAENDEDLQYGYRKGNLFDFFLQARFRLGQWKHIGRYFNFQVAAPTDIRSFPAVVEVEYQNKTTIQIGGKDPKHPDQWQTLFNLIGGYDWGWIMNSVTFRFEVIPPEGIDKDALWYRLDPEFVSISPNAENFEWKGIENVLLTNLTIELYHTKNTTNPAEDFILKVKVIHEDVSHPWLLHTYPKYVNIFNYRKNLPILMENATSPYGTSWNPTSRFMYNFNGITFWLANKAHNLPVVYKYVNNIVSILVRVKKDHFAELLPPEPVNIYPDSLISIPVKVTNLGSHIDTFNFRVNNTDENIKVVEPSALTIEPGETRNAYVAVSTPSGMMDIGKTISLSIEAYSIEEPENIFSNSITITLEGIHLSMGFAYYIAIVGIILIILFSFIYIPKKRRRDTICIKPDKPWLIEKEKEHLEKLREKDKKIYDETLKMMNEEYKSALLWHKYYTDAVIREDRNLKREEETKKKDKKLKMKAKIKEEKKEKKEKEKELKKQAEIEIKKKEPEIKEEPKIPKKKEEEKLVLIDRKAELEKRKKEITLFKIKQQQEKQRKKFGSSI